MTAIKSKMNFNTLAKEIYEQNKAIGWWDNPNRCKYQTLQLVSTEIAEATEGERKNLMDNHLPHRKMGEVELADALIRILDMAGAYGWKFSPVKEEYPDDNIRATLEGIESVGGKHLVLNFPITCIGIGLLDGDQESVDVGYSVFIDGIFHVANTLGYDLYGAMSEKLEYNKTRADHKRENRAKQNGKKF